MHLAITFIVILLVYWKGDWRNLDRYLLTMLYISICDLLYNMLCRDYLLWHYHPDIFPNSHVGVNLLYTFIILPGIALLFLSFFPYSKTISHRVLYSSFWIAGSFLFSWFLEKSGRLILEHGYKIWMDLPFYIAMYSLLRLHATRPLVTYGISTLIILFMLNYFNVPIK